MQEIWKPVVGYEGYYDVSNFGNIKSLERIITRSDGVKLTVKEKILSKTYNDDGYLTVKLSKNGNNERIGIHRVVAMAFLENLNNLPEVNHIDYNRENNCVSNLEWISHVDNVRHSSNSGRYSNRTGELNPNYGNTKLRDFFKAHPEETARQARKGAQNGRCIPVVMIDAMGIESKFSYIRECAKYLIDNQCTKAKSIEIVANNIKKSIVNNTEYANCHFARY